MEAGRSNSRSLRRNPLSDRTNIIPSSTNRNFTKSSNPNSDPLQIPKYYKQSPDSAKSNSSVGSTTSTTTKNDHNSAGILRSKPTTPGDENNEIPEPLTVYRRKLTNQKTKKIGNTVEITNDKGKTKETDVPFAALLGSKDKGKEIVDSFRKTQDLEKISNEKSIEKSFSSLKRNYKSTKSVMPPLQHTSDNNDGGLLKFQTDPYLKQKKKRRIVDDPTPELQKEFKDLRAYFKEVDEFELPVEEVSD